VVLEHSWKRDCWHTEALKNPSQLSSQTPPQTKDNQRISRSRNSAA
jgi:hypothetical protein